MKLSEYCVAALVNGDQNHFRLQFAAPDQFKHIREQRKKRLENKVPNSLKKFPLDLSPKRTELKVGFRKGAGLTDAWLYGSVYRLVRAEGDCFGLVKFKYRFLVQAKFFGADWNRGYDGSEVACCYGPFVVTRLFSSENFHHRIKIQSFSSRCLEAL